MNAETSKISKKVRGIQVDFKEKEISKSIEVSHLLNATGRISTAKFLDISNTEIDLDERGFIKIDNNYNTTQPNIWAIGDVTGNPMFTHAARDESEQLYQAITKKSEIIKKIIPYAIFLFYLYKIKSVNIFVKTGFSLTVLFVFITILVSIFTLNYYDKTLVEVDFLHGFAESFLTLSDFVILLGFMKILNNLEVNNS